MNHRIYSDRRIYNSIPEQEFIKGVAIKIKVSNRKHIYITERSAEIDVDQYERLFTIRIYQLVDLNMITRIEAQPLKRYKDLVVTYKFIHVSESTIVAVMAVLLNIEEFKKVWEVWGKIDQNKTIRK